MGWPPILKVCALGNDGLIDHHIDGSDNTKVQLHFPSCSRPSTDQ
jgi:hypothetical protein